MSFSKSGNSLVEVVASLAIFAMVASLAVSGVRKNNVITRKLAVQARALVTLDNAVERIRLIESVDAVVYKKILAEEFAANHLDVLPGLQATAEVQSNAIRLVIGYVQGKEVAVVQWEEEQ